MESLERRLLLATLVTRDVCDDTTWTAAESPYLIEGDVRVCEGAKLTVEPGVTFNTVNQLHELEVYGELIADDAYFAARVWFQEGSTGTITNSRFTAFGPSLSIAENVTIDLNHNDFTSGSVKVMPEFVPLLAGMTNAYAPGSHIPVYSGFVSNDTTWPLIGETAGFVTDGIVIESDAKLTIEPGVTVNLTNAVHSIGVYGTLDATGATFPFRIQFFDGSQGTLRGNTFTSYEIEIYDGASPVIEGNFFHNNLPVELPPDFVPEFGEMQNTFTACDTVIGIAGSLSKDVTWPHIPGAPHYQLGTGLVVAEDVTLTIDPGVRVSVVLPNHGIEVEGTLIANAVDFRDRLTFGPHSTVRLRNSRVAEWLEINGRSDAVIEGNDFGDVGVIYAIGSENEVIDLRNNAWGTNNRIAIEERLLHQNDVPDLPRILFEPIVPLDSDRPTPLITGPEGATADNPFEITVDFGETVFDVRMCDFDVAGGTMTDLTVNDDGNLTAVITAENDGVVTVGLPQNQASDLAGNRNLASNVYSVIVDTTPPELEIQDPVLIEGNVEGGADIVASMLVEFAMATDNLDDDVEIIVEVPEFIAVNQSAEAIFTARDEAGNTTTQSSVVTVVDTTPPVITVPDSRSFEADTIGGANHESGELANWLALATAKDIVDGDVLVTHNVEATLPLGTHEVIFRAVDRSSNTGEESPFAHVRDTTPPDLEVPGEGLTVEGDTVGGVQLINTEVQDWFAQAKATDIHDGNVPVKHDLPETIPLGETTVTFTATDKSDKSSSDASSITVIDTTPPEVFVREPIVVEASEFGGAPADHPRIKKWLSDARAYDIVFGDLPVEHNAPEFFPLSTTTVVFTAHDGAENVGGNESSIEVVDTIPPRLTVPASFEIKATAPSGIPIKDLFRALKDDITVIDIADPSPVVDITGSEILGVGEQVIEVFAEDATGNQTGTKPVVVTVLAAFDFGDAPNADQSGFAKDYPVTIADDGASHLVSDLHLGTMVDSDLDGQPADFAGVDGISGDDHQDDEDGVVSIATVVISDDMEATSSFLVTASEAGKLDAWVDFNRDGDWDDEREQIVVSFEVTAGENIVGFAVPSGASVGGTATRFRLSSEGDLDPTGTADDGEVEDHWVELVAEDDANVVVGPLSKEATVSIGNSIRVYSQGDLFFDAGLDRLSSVQVNLVDARNSTLRFGSSDIPLEMLTLETGIVEGMATIVELSSNWKMLPSEIEQAYYRVIGFNETTVMVDMAFPYQNLILSTDVNGSGGVTANDALVVINELARRQFSEPSGRVIDPMQLDGVRSGGGFSGDFFDVTGDDLITALDALRCINELTRTELPPPEAEQIEWSPVEGLSERGDAETQSVDSVVQATTFAAADRAQAFAAPPTSAEPSDVSYEPRPARIEPKHVDQLLAEQNDPFLF